MMATVAKVLPAPPKSESRPVRDSASL
jgi:hypothetical protein